MRKSVLILAGVIAASAAGGAAIAGAAGDGEDAGHDQAITGAALDRATRVALRETGGGRVTETEANDQESYYQVEVTNPDGSQTDVNLDRDFNVVKTKTEREHGDG